MRLLLDTNVLMRLCHPGRYPDVKSWIRTWADYAARAVDVEIIVSAVSDYELRRGYLYKADRKADEDKALERLDQLCELLGVQQISQSNLRVAAQLWADARRGEYSTASERDVDWDVLIAAQAREIPAVVVTSNAKHVKRYGVDAKDWHEIPTPTQEGGT